MTAGNLGRTLGAAAAVIALAVTTPAAAGPSLATAETARPPPAFAGFCARHPADCRPSGANVSAIRLTLARRTEIAIVNGTINRTTREVSDLELYGREDVWAYPVDGMGDCEDFALAKRRDLIAAGWPSSVLLVTVVRDRRGEGHAVLTVVTDVGDLILDNRTDSIRLWSETPYTYFHRQSAANPKTWVALAPADAVVATKGGSKNGSGAAGAGGKGSGAATSAAGAGNSSAGGGNANAGGGNGNTGGNANAGSGNSNAGGNGNDASGGNSGDHGGGNANAGSGNSNAGGNGSAASGGNAAGKSR